MKKTVTIVVFGLLTTMMSGCGSFKSSFPKYLPDLAYYKGEKESHLIQMRGFEDVDSIQLWIQNKYIDLRRIAAPSILGPYSDGVKRYYYDILIQRRPHTRNYYLYLFHIRPSKHNPSQCFHNRKVSDGVTIRCQYGKDVRECTLREDEFRNVILLFYQDTIELHKSNYISLLE